MSNTATRSALLRRMIDTRISVVGVEEAIRELDEAVAALKERCGITDTGCQRENIAYEEGYEKGEEEGGAEARAAAEKEADDAYQRGVEEGLRRGGLVPVSPAWA